MPATMEYGIYARKRAWACAASFRQITLKLEWEDEAAYSRASSRPATSSHLPLPSSPFTVFLIAVFYEGLKEEVKDEIYQIELPRASSSWSRIEMRSGMLRLTSFNRPCYLEDRVTVSESGEDPSGVYAN